MLYVPSSRDFKWSLRSITSRPAAAFGTTVTASASTNTMGSWVNIISGASVTEDVWGILINANSVGASTTNTDMLLNIGIDEAGGTSFTVKIPYLIISEASGYTIGSGGVWYYFPLFIKSGSSIGAQVQCVTASRTARVMVTLYGQPRRPESTRLAHKVIAFGVNSSGASGGTNHTAGTTNKSTWAQIGSATDRSLWWWQLGHGYAGTAQVAAAWEWDMGAGGSTSTVKTIASEIVTCTTTGEILNNSPMTEGCVCNVATGDYIYVRGRCSGTPPANTNIAIYGCG